MRQLDTDPDDFAWAIPFMRAGYFGRGLVYTVIGGFSLYAISRGGQAQGTSQAFKQLETTWWGVTVLVGIALGLAAYAIWRAVDAFWDLEAYGSDAKAWIARSGMIVTGAIHLALAGAAAALIWTGGSSGGGSGSGGGTAASGGGSGGEGSKIAEAVSWIMSQPYGVWLVGAAGLLTVGAGLYYIKKAVAQDYRENLQASQFTLNWNPALMMGVAAQGVTVTIVGGFLVYAAMTTDPSQAGGLGKTFQWLSQQAYGRVLVGVLCAGLLAFAFFCYVNAGYRIVPRAAGDDTTTLARRLKAAAR